MRAIEVKLETKYINELTRFYNCNHDSLDNSMISRFLLLKKYLPGSRPFELIYKFYQNTHYNNYPCFLFLQKKFESIRKDLYMYFYFLRKNNFEGSNIIKFQNLLLEFYTWCILNELEFELIDDNDIKNYFQQTHYRMIHAFSDDVLVIETINYYRKMQSYKKYNSIPRFTDCVEKKIPDNDVVSSYLLNTIHSKDLKILLYLVLKTGLSWKTVLKIRRKDINYFWQTINYQTINSKKKYMYVFDAQIKENLINYNSLIEDIYLISLHNPFFPSESRENRLLNLFSKELSHGRMLIPNKVYYLDNLYSLYHHENIRKSDLSGFLKNPLSDTL